VANGEDYPQMMQMTQGNPSITPIGLEEIPGFGIIGGLSFGCF
jgi:hypothetical protein